jgi:hypothetical protein
MQSPLGHVPWQQQQQQQHPMPARPSPVSVGNAAIPLPPAAAAAAALPGEPPEEEFRHLELLQEANEQRVVDLVNQHCQAGGYLRTQAGCDAAAALLQRLVAIAKKKYHDDDKKMGSMLANPEQRDVLMQALWDLQQAAGFAVRQQPVSRAGVRSMLCMASAGVSIKNIGGKTTLLGQCCTAATGCLHITAIWTLPLLSLYASLCGTAGHCLCDYVCRDALLTAAAAVRGEGGKCSWEAEQLLIHLRKVLRVSARPSALLDLQLPAFAALDEAIAEHTRAGDYKPQGALEVQIALSKLGFMPGETAKATTQCLKDQQQQQQQQQGPTQQQLQQQPDQEADLKQQQQQQQQQQKAFMVAACATFAYTCIGAYQQPLLPLLVASMCANVPSIHNSASTGAVLQGMQALVRLPDGLDKYVATLRLLAGVLKAALSAGCSLDEAQYCQLSEVHMAAEDAGVDLAPDGDSYQQQQQQGGVDSEEQPAKRARHSTAPSPAAAGAQELRQEPGQQQQLDLSGCSTKAAEPLEAKGSSATGAGSSQGSKPAQSQPAHQTSSAQGKSSSQSSSQSSSSSSSNEGPDKTPGSWPWSKPEVAAIAAAYVPQQKAGLIRVLPADVFKVMVTHKVRSMQPRRAGGPTQDSTIEGISNHLMKLGYIVVPIGNERLLVGPKGLIVSVDGLLQCDEGCFIIEVDGHSSHFLMAPAHMEADLLELGIATPEKDTAAAPGSVLFYPSGATMARNSKLQRHFPLLALPTRRLRSANREAETFVKKHGVKQAGLKRKACA